MPVGLAHNGTVSIASEDVRVVYLGYLMQEIWDSALLQVLESTGLFVDSHHVP